jgi:hypothetical protein
MGNDQLTCRMDGVGGKFMVATKAKRRRWLRVSWARGKRVPHLLAEKETCVVARVAIRWFPPVRIARSAGLVQ